MSKLPLQFRTPDVDAEWADSRKTHMAVATAIHAISAPLRSAEAIWEAPTWAEWDTVHVAVENYVGAGVFPAEDDGRYQWGEEAVLLSQSTDEA